MLLPIYTVVALINIFAQIQNYNMKTTKNLPYEIRVRRDAVKELLSDINNKSINHLSVNTEIGNFIEKAPRVIARNSVTTTTDAKPKSADDIDEYNIEIDHVENKNDKRKITDSVINVIYKIFNEIEEQRQRRNEKAATNLETESSNLDINKKPKSTARSILEEVIIKPVKIPEETETNPQTNENKQKYANLLTRIKRNVRAYDNNVANGLNNYPVQTNNNYFVTEKTTLNKAVSWFNSWINPHEKHIITEPEVNFYSNNGNNKPYAAYNNEVTTQITSVSYNNWNNQNMLNYKSKINEQAKFQPPNYNANKIYYNSQTYVPYYNNNNKTAINNNTNGIYPLYNNNYMGVNNNYGSYYNNKTAINNNTNGIYPLYNNNYMGVNYDYGSYYNNNTAINNNTNNGIYTSYNNNYTGVNNNYGGYINNYNNGYSYNSNNPYPTIEVTTTTSDSENNVETTESVIQGCFMCGSFGCPKFTRRVGFVCMPIRH